MSESEIDDALALHVFQDCVGNLREITLSLRHHQYMFTEPTLWDVRKELCPDMCERIGAGCDSTEKERLIKEMDLRVAQHYCCFNDEFNPSSMLSWEWLDRILFMYKEEGLEYLKYYVDLGTLSDTFGEKIGRMFNAIDKAWEAFIWVIKSEYLRGYKGCLKAELACRLLNEIFQLRCCDFEGKIDRHEYRQKLESFQWWLVDLAAECEKRESEKTIKSVSLSDEDDYDELGRQIIVDAYRDEWDKIGYPEVEENFERLYYIVDTKDPDGYKAKTECAKKDARLRKESPQNVVITKVEKEAEQSFRRAFKPGGRPVVKSVRFTQGMVAALCRVTISTVANWEKGRTKKVPNGYTREMREKGGIEFYNFITQYWQGKELNKNLKQFLEGKVAYLEGLTEKESGMVQDFIIQCREARN